MVVGTLFLKIASIVLLKPISKNNPRVNTYPLKYAIKKKKGTQLYSIGLTQ